MSVAVGIVDGGFERVPLGVVRGAMEFAIGGDGAVGCRTPVERALPHGECVAALVLEAAPAVRLIDARIATPASQPTPRVVAAAIDWCVAEGARIVNLSLGLADDRRVLRDACARAVAQGVVLVAAAPARGGPVYPAAYPGVFSVSGDARCAAGEWSRLDATVGAAWGTCPDAPGGARGGASMAAARFTGLVADYLMHHPGADARGLADHLATFASRRGRENRRIAEIDS